MCRLIKGSEDVLFYPTMAMRAGILQLCHCRI